MVSPITSDLLTAPGPDPRWDFAFRLTSGAFDDVLAGSAAGPVDRSLEDVEIGFMKEVAPVAPATLPAGLIGPRAAGLGHVALHSTWWWPDGLEVPASPVAAPKPAQILRSRSKYAYLAVRLEISDEVLEMQIVSDPAPLQDLPEDAPPAGPADGLR